MTKKTKRKKGLILKLIIAVSFLVLLYSSYDIVNWTLSVQRSNSIKERINKKVKQDNNKLVVDFKSLLKQNPDTVGYLRVNNTKIDYVVLKSKDNTYYLDHNFDKQNNLSGWIFANYKNNVDGSDKNLVIFGHNMKDGSMFGELKKTQTKEWINDQKNLAIKFITEKKSYTYKVFSVYTTSVEEYYIKTEFDNNDFIKFKKNLKFRSIHDFNVNVNNNKNILTLSTCSGNGNKRVVLHAILT